MLHAAFCVSAASEPHSQGRLRPLYICGSVSCRRRNTSTYCANFHYCKVQIEFFDRRASILPAMGVPPAFDVHKIHHPHHSEVRSDHYLKSLKSSILSQRVLPTQRSDCCSSTSVLYSRSSKCFQLQCNASVQYVTLFNMTLPLQSTAIEILQFGIHHARIILQQSFDPLFKRLDHSLCNLGRDIPT